MKKQKRRTNPGASKKRKRPSSPAPLPKAPRQPAPAAAPGLSGFAPPSVDGQLDRARKALAQGDWRAAHAAGRDALMAAPDDVDALNVTGVAAFHTGNRAEALSLFDTALAFHPGHGEALMNRGNVLSDMGQWDAAEAAYRAVLKTAPDHAGARFNLGVLLEIAGRFPDAEAAFRRILAREPDHAEALFHLGNILKALNRLPDALAQYDAALKAQPGHAGAATNRGAVLQETGKPLEARAAYAQALAAEPDNADARYNLGTLLQETGHAADAITEYEAVLARDPGHAGAQVNIAYALRELGRLDDALDASRKAIALAPDYDKARVNLGDLLLEMGRPADAVTETAAFLATHPGNTSALAFQAIALNEAGDRAGAAHLLDFARLLRAQEISPPEGFADVAAFNQALARHLRAHPSLAYAPASHATRRGRHSGELTIGDRGPVAELESAIMAAVEAYRTALPADPDHPFLAQRPGNLSLSVWGVVMEDRGHQIAHIHPAAWLSGVYYPEIPEIVRNDDPDHQGWIEFGRPPGDFHAAAAPITTRLCPRDGLMLLFPSYLYHETVPFQAPVERLSIAFDVMAGD